MPIHLVSNKSRSVQAGTPLDQVSLTPIPRPKLFGECHLALLFRERKQANPRADGCAQLAACLKLSSAVSAPGTGTCAARQGGGMYALRGDGDGARGNSGGECWRGT
jgi:hypothetical protein